MGLILIILSSLSGIINLIVLFMIMKLSQIYSETNAIVPFWTKNAWVLIVIFLVINILTILYGRFLLKHPESNKEYLWMSILLFILVFFGMSLGLKYLILPILMNIYSTVNTI